MCHSIKNLPKVFTIKQDVVSQLDDDGMRVLFIIIH